MPVKFQKNVGQSGLVVGNKINTVYSTYSNDKTYLSFLSVVAKTTAALAS